MEVAKDEDDAPPLVASGGVDGVDDAAVDVDYDDAVAASTTRRPHVTFADPLTRQMSVQSTRPDYFQNLRRGSVTNLRLEGDGNDDANDDDDGERRDGGRRSGGSVVDMEIAVADLRRRLSATWTGNDGDRASYGSSSVEVRLRDFSYRVPVRVDGPSINTALNTSPCYVATNVIKNFGEYITGKRKVRGNTTIVIASRALPFPLRFRF